MAWSETTILDRAKEYARTYADEERLSVTDVRAVVQELALKQRIFYGQDSFTTVMGQREYVLPTVIEVVRVYYDTGYIPHSYRQGVGYTLRPGRLVLNFSPPANKQLVVEGYVVPAAVDGITLQPEVMWMDAIALLVAARLLLRYGDSQTVPRAGAYQQDANGIIAELMAQVVQPYAPLPASTVWNYEYIRLKAREILRKYNLSSYATEPVVISAARDTILKARVYGARTTHTTAGGRRDYPLGDVVYVDRVYYDGGELYRQYKDSRVMGYYVDKDRLYLTWEPDAGKTLVIEGYGMPSDISEIALQPADVFMDGIAHYVAHKVIIEHGTPQILGAAGVHLAQYREMLKELDAVSKQTRVYRAGRRTSQGSVSLV